MKKGQGIEIYWSKVLSKTYPYFQIAEEIVTILIEESKNEKYVNYNGYFHRSITIHELLERLKKNKIKASHIKVGKTIHSLLNINKIPYDYQKRSAGGASSVYREIIYSHKELEKLGKIIQELRGNEIMPYSYS